MGQEFADEKHVHANPVTSVEKQRGSIDRKKYTMGEIRHTDSLVVAFTVICFLVYQQSTDIIKYEWDPVS